MNTITSWIQKHAEPLVVTIGILLLLGVSLLSGPYVANSLDQISEVVRGFGPWSIVAFGVLYLILSVVGVSTVLLTVLAGALFGAFFGIIIVVVAATGAGIIAFLLARYFSQRFGYHTKSLQNRFIKKLEHHATSKGFTTVALLRLSFLPYIPLSCACGLVHQLRFKDYFWATLSTNILGSTVFILLGASFQGSLILFACAVTLAGLLFLLSHHVKSRDTIRTKT